MHLEMVCDLVNPFFSQLTGLPKTKLIRQFINKLFSRYDQIAYLSFSCVKQHTESWELKKAKVQSGEELNLCKDYKLNGELKA